MRSGLCQEGGTTKTSLPPRPPCSARSVSKCNRHRDPHSPEAQSSGTAHPMHTLVPWPRTKAECRQQCPWAPSRPMLSGHAVTTALRPGPEVGRAAVFPLPFKRGPPGAWKLDPRAAPQTRPPPWAARAAGQETDWLGRTHWSAVAAASGRRGAGALFPTAVVVVTGPRTWR